MYKTTLMLFLGMFLTLQLLSQHQIEIKKGKFSLESFHSGGQRIGFLGKNIEPILKKDPLAYIEFKKYRKNEIITISGAGLSVLGIVCFAKGYSTTDANQEWLIPFGSISMLTGLISTISSGIISKRRFKKAIHLYNGTNNTFGFIPKNEELLILNSVYFNGGIGINLAF